MWRAGACCALQVSLHLGICCRIVVTSDTVFTHLPHLFDIVQIIIDCKDVIGPIPILLLSTAWRTGVGRSRACIPLPRSRSPSRLQSSSLSNSSTWCCGRSAASYPYRPTWWRWSSARRCSPPQPPPQALPPRTQHSNNSSKQISTRIFLPHYRHGYTATTPMMRRYCLSRRLYDRIRDIIDRRLRIISRVGNGTICVHHHHLCFLRL